MKKLTIYIPDQSFKNLVQILQDSEVDGISYHEIMGQGNLERKISEKIVQGYRTQEKFIPEFSRRIQVETIVSDAKAEEILATIQKNGSIKGKISVSNVLELKDL
jgi:nitrogen regulatory protein P-II 1